MHSDTCREEKLLKELRNAWSFITLAAQTIARGDSDQLTVNQFRKKAHELAGFQPDGSDLKRFSDNSIKDGERWLYDGVRRANKPGIPLTSDDSYAPHVARDPRPAPESVRAAARKAAPKADRETDAIKAKRSASTTR